MKLPIEDYMKLASRTKPSVDHDLNSAVTMSNNVTILHAMIGMVSEVGEIADTIKRWAFYGQDLNETNIREELGDLMWYIALLCNDRGFDMGEIMQENINKLMERYPSKFTIEDAIGRKDKVNEGN